MNNYISTLHGFSSLIAKPVFTSQTGLKTTTHETQTNRILMGNQYSLIKPSIKLKQSRWREKKKKKEASERSIKGLRSGKKRTSERQFTR